MPRRNALGSNRLPELAARIRHAHASTQNHAENAVRWAMDAGHRLIEAKELVPHGQWASWLQTNCHLSARTARRYMQLARSGLETATVADLGIRGAAEAIAKRKPEAEAEPADDGPLAGLSQAALDEAAEKPFIDDEDLAQAARLPEDEQAAYLQRRHRERLASFVANNVRPVPAGPPQVIEVNYQPRDPVVQRLHIEQPQGRPVRPPSDEAPPKAPAAECATATAAIAELEAIVQRITALQRADRLSHEGYQVIIEDIVAQIGWLRRQIRAALERKHRD
jgi:hypothetical protein